jgi:hypothetical protein
MGVASRFGLPCPQSPQLKAWAFSAAAMVGFSYHAEQAILHNSNRMDKDWGSGGSEEALEDMWDERVTSKRPAPSRTVADKK